MSSASYKSVVEMFRDRVHSTPDGQAMLFKRNDEWAHITWREVGEKVHLQACGLRALGMENEQRCSIVSATRPEWVTADMAILSAGCATTTIYPNNTPDECSYILQDSGTRVVYVENKAQADKLRGVRGEIPGVMKLVTFTDGADGDWVITVEDLEKLGAAWDKEHPEELKAIGDAIESHHLATLIYTSGTTGRAKGVMLTHDCWVYEGEGIDDLDILLPSDRQYLFLPLAHSFAKVLEITFIRLGIPTVVDGNTDLLVKQLGETNPTFMACVPRIFEKVYNKVVDNAKQGGAVKWAIFQWALSVGRQVSALRQQRKEPTGFLALKNKIADKLVFSKLKALFGGRMRFFISGGAPLSKEIAEFFHAADVLVLEGYGLTESSAATFVNRPESFKFGTVGPALPGTQVRIDDDGEILLKGRGVMQGYYNRPEDSAEAFTEDGWFRTGDIGKVDGDGFLAITDRKKDIIVTAGGKNVAPQNIENTLKARCPYVSQIVLHGDKRNFCSALITINEEMVGKWAKERGLTWNGYAELAAKPEVRGLLQEAIDTLNAELASYESIKKFAILDHDFTVESGELTPKMSIKRKVVENANKALLDGFYEGTVKQI
ncbi:MAG: long-chain fatty acid--CoA ligase [Pseudomonadota bacterium]